MKTDNMVIKMGQLYKFVYRFPVYGNRMVRSLCRGIAVMTFHSPSMKMKKHNSIQGVKEELEKLNGLSDGELVITKEDETSFEYMSTPCPYGYSPEDPKGLCDAVMDMNRKLFKLCGAKIIIHDRISGGAEKCRVTVRMNDK